MDSNGQVISTETAWVVLGLFIFGVFYNWLVADFQKKTGNYTAELVAGGVLVTLVASGFVIGWSNTFVLIILFTASGLPMMIGFWLRIARDEQQARSVSHEDLKKMMDQIKGEDLKEPHK